MVKRDSSWKGIEVQGRRYRGTEEVRRGRDGRGEDKGGVEK